MPTLRTVKRDWQRRPSGDSRDTDPPCRRTSTDRRGRRNRFRSPRTIGTAASPQSRKPCDAKTIIKIRHGLSEMPPINRENLRDVLIAIALATVLVWVVGAFQGSAANSPPALPSLIARLVPSRAP